MNLLFQYGNLEYLDMAMLTFKRHDRMAKSVGGFHFFERRAKMVTPFWQKWAHLHDWMRKSEVTLFIASDADVIWQHPQNIFEALPADEQIGITWVNDCPSSGVIWIRNTPAMRNFVDTVISMEEEFCRFPSADQAAMLTVAERTGTKLFRIADEWHGMEEDSVLRGFHCLPNRLELMRGVMKDLDAKAGESRIPA